MKYMLKRLACLTLPLTAATAIAQEDLETITIVGELQTKTLQEAQTSVSVLTGTELEQGADENLYDHVNKMANVNSVFGDKGFAIRGVTQYGVGGGSDDGTNGLINITIDGASLPTIISGIYGPDSTWDIEQVEVLRGAQSTQQGRNALTGAVYIKTADPEFYDETKFRARIGQANHTELAFAKNLVVFEDKLAFRFSGEHSEKDGYVKNTTRSDETYNTETFDNFRVKLKANLTDDLNVVFGHNYAKREAGADLIQADKFPGKRVSESDAEADQGSTHNITTLSANYWINDTWWLESLTTHYKHEHDRDEDTDYSAVSGNHFLLETNDKSFSQELKLGFDNQEGLNGVIGVFYTKIENKYDQDITLPLNRVIDVNALIETTLPPAVAQLIDSLPFDVGPIIDFVAGDSVTLNPLQTYTKETINTAFYSEVDYEFNEHWVASLGFRYDEEKVDQTSFAHTTVFLKQFDILRFDYLPASKGSNDTSYDAFLPKASVRYNIDNDKSIGLVVQQAYRAGGVQRNPITLQINEYDPEYTTNYELVFRSQWLNDVITFNANLFHTDWKDMQVPIYGTSGNQYDFDTVNAGEAELHGLELDSYVLVTPALEVNLGIGYVKTEFTDFVSNGVNLKGNEFAFAPKLSSNIGFSYTVSEFLTWDTDLSYQDDHFNNVANDKDQTLPSRVLVDSKITYDAGDWSLALVGKNLLDEEYETQLFNDNTQTLARAGDPRYLGLVYNLRYSK